MKTITTRSGLDISMINYYLIISVIRLLSINLNTAIVSAAY